MDVIPQFYPDAEDTYLLMDALELDITRNVHKLESAFFSVEIGPGGGRVSEHFLDVCRKSGILPFHLAVDVNRHAAEETRKVCGRAGFTDVIVADKFTFARPDFQADIIFCNPPYVPSSPINRARDIRASYAGGERGREFIDELLPVVASRLSENGIFYLLLERRNDVNEVLEVASREFGFKSELLNERKIRGEHLFVYRFHR